MRRNQAAAARSPAAHVAAWADRQAALRNEIVYTETEEREESMREEREEERETTDNS